MGNNRWGIFGTALAAFGLSTAVLGADTVPVCYPGPAVVEEMLPAIEPLPPGDVNAVMLRRAADCDWLTITDEAGLAAVSQFRGVAHDNGLAGALRTFARNGDFRLFLPGESQMELGAANNYLNSKRWTGDWQESARGRSPDSTLLFAVGELSVSKRVRYRYAQIWQFDPKVANWGLRLLLVQPISIK